MKKSYKILTALLILIPVIFPLGLFAKIGVGIATGKIVVDQELKPGIIYSLPPITVINTGDETSNYNISVAYHEKQTELMPPEDWFVFSPKEFELRSGGTQVVDVKVNLPLKTDVGKYFAYIEASPTRKSKEGSSTIGIAAATKLYFEIVPANFFQAIFYKLTSLWKLYTPWPQRISILLGVVLLLFVFKKFFNVDIKLKNKTKTKNE